MITNPSQKHLLKSIVLFFLCIGAVQVASAQSVSYGISMTDQAKKDFEADLQFLISIKGKKSTPLHKSIFGQGTTGASLDGKSLFEFFSSRINSVRFDVNEKTYNAYVDLEINRHEMVLSSQYLDDGSQIYRVSSLIHEARHSEASGWHHRYCPEKDLNGNDIVSIQKKIKLFDYLACDATASGAYGVEIVFLQNISKFCENCSAEMRAEAKDLSEKLLTRIIDPAAYKLLTEDAASSGD